MTDEIDAANLSFEELDCFQGALSILMDAGRQALGYKPRFCVVPGKDLTMTLDFSVPVARSGWTAAHTSSAEITDPVLILPEFAAPEMPRAAAAAETAPKAAAPEIAAPEAKAPEPAPSPKPLPWTEAEDDLAVAAYVADIRAGATQTSAYASAAAAADRPFEGARFRMRNKLADRAQAALAYDTPPEAPPAPQPAAQPQAVAAAADAADALTTHLATMPRKDAWSIEADLELARLSVENGWGLQDIAVEFGMDTGMIKARWDALTGLHRDKTSDKLVRRFQSGDVLAGLQQLAAA